MTVRRSMVERVSMTQTVIFGLGNVTLETGFDLSDSNSRTHLGTLNQNGGLALCGVVDPILQKQKSNIYKAPAFHVFLLQRYFSIDFRDICGYRLTDRYTRQRDERSGETTVN